jgi:translation initiation factor 2A
MASEAEVDKKPKQHLPVHMCGMIFFQKFIFFTAHCLNKNCTVRRKEGWQAYSVAAEATKPVSALTSTCGNPIVPSPCGRYLASMDGEQFVIYQLDATVAGDDSNKAPVVHATLARRGIVGCVFSPRGTFVATFETPIKGRPGPNLLVWDVASMQCRLRLHQREWLPNTYGYPIQWTSDESRCAHQRTASIAVYDGHLPLEATESVEAVADESAETVEESAGNKSGNQPVHMLPVANLVQFSLAPYASSNLLAIFCKGVKGAPSSMKLYDLNKLDAPKVSKSIFAAERVELKWNALCTHVIMLCHTEVDATGASYGGGTQLFFFATDASFQTQVSFKEEGQVQAVEWNPKGGDFIVIHGRPPFQATLFGVKDCTPIFEFGKAAYNTIRFSPHGRFVMLGGFANLAGHMQFWDKNKLKKMGEAQHHSARYEKFYIVS